MTRPGKFPTGKARIGPRVYLSRGGRLNHKDNEPVCELVQCTLCYTVLHSFDVSLFSAQCGVQSHMSSMFTSLEYSGVYKQSYIVMVFVVQSAVWYVTVSNSYVCYSKCSVAYNSLTKL